MKAVILAAGRSTRTMPLTENIPKAMLRVANKTILEHNLEQLSGLVDEAIIVVGFKKEQVMNVKSDLMMRFVEQKQQLGTGDALKAAQPHLKERFILLMGDNLYFREDIKECLKKQNAILVLPVPNPHDFGIVEEEKGKLKRITEKPKKPKRNLANAALYVLQPDILPLLKNLNKSRRQELEITDAINVFAQKNRVAVVKAKRCFFITYPWDLLQVNEQLLKEVKSEVLGVVEEGATLKGEVRIGEGTLVTSGSYVEGPVVIGKNCKIGPNCYIRPYTSVGDNCKVGNAVELKGSILFDNVSIRHLSYFGDSIIANNTNIGAGTIVANLRHDNASIKSMIKGRLIDSGRRKLGTIIGDNVHTGIHTTIYPGRKIFSGRTTKPGEIVKKDEGSDL